MKNNESMASDLISRQEALDILDELQTAHEEGEDKYEECRKKMCDLPSGC